MNIGSPNYKRNKIKMLKDYLLIIIGSIITAAGMNVFLIPNKIAPGGVSGIATVIYHLSGGTMPVGIVMLALNIPLFVMGIKYIGKRFFVRTLVGTILLSLIVDIFQPLTGNFVKSFLTSAESLNYSPDLLLYSVFGGLFMGVGLGLVFKSGATTGGSDLAAKIISHFIPNFTVGQILLFIDACIIIFAAVVFKSFIIGLYAIVTLFIMSKVIDAILEGVNFAKAVYIISDKSDEIAGKILYDLDRGVTALKGTGMYTGKDREVLMCVLYRAQISQVKQIVKAIDPDAFIILADVREVLGEGFKSHD
jgi:uncharacterized membrane-anchored protein YitT (DUF2179 family)